MKQRRTLLLLLLLLLVGAACASGRAGSPLYRRDIGTATGPDAFTLAEQVIHRHGYEIEQSDTIPEIRIVTKWKPRQPVRDEMVLGITSAENRIIVVGRIRGQSELGAYYNVNMTIENRVQVAGSSEWNETLNTDLFREYADNISNDYRQLIANIGVRRF
ncbi:hypothetical protein BH23GEM9_BH23GEM9_34020 [soil metagenome]